jgi:hypothetical protein
MVDALAVQAVQNQCSDKILHQLLTGWRAGSSSSSSDGHSQVMLVSISASSHTYGCSTYGQLLTSLLADRGMLCVGLYRRELSCVTGEHVSYVLTRPAAGTLLLPDDEALVMVDLAACGACLPADVIGFDNPGSGAGRETFCTAGGPSSDSTGSLAVGPEMPGQGMQKGELWDAASLQHSGQHSSDQSSSRGTESGSHNAYHSQLGVEGASADADDSRQTGAAALQGSVGGQLRQLCCMLQKMQQEQQAAQSSMRRLHLDVRHLGDRVSGVQVGLKGLASAAEAGGHR